MQFQQLRHARMLHRQYNIWSSLYMCSSKNAFVNEHVIIEVAVVILKLSILELATTGERRMNISSVQQNLERQMFDTSSAEPVASCNVGVTLKQTPLHSYRNMKLKNFSSKLPFFYLKTTLIVASKGEMIYGIFPKHAYMFFTKCVHTGQAGNFV